MKNLIVDLIEILFSLGLFINAALFIPQLFTLLKTKNPKGLSLVTFSGFNFIQLVTVLHAYILKDYLLMGGYLVSFVTCGCVTYFIVMYRYRWPQKD